MITFDEQTLYAMNALKDNEFWKVIVQSMFQNAQELKDDVIHRVPASDDVGFNIRFHMARGMVAAIDTIANTMANAEALLAEERVRTETEAAMKKALDECKEGAF